MTTKSRRRRKAKAPVVCVAQTTGTAAPPADPAPGKTTIDQAMADFEAVRKGIADLTSPAAAFHRSLGQTTCQLAVMIAPKVIAALRAARRAWSKPDAEAKRRAKTLAKRWGV